MQPESARSAQAQLRRVPDRDAVRTQLERILADPLFKHSKRYPNLFRYVVEHTLDDATADLKERTLGVAVFGREPTYDTSTDPIVRATAGEIRKRIAQYYQEPGREKELRISLSPGSYVPEFTTPAISVSVPSAEVPHPAPSHSHAWAVAAISVVALALGAAWLKPWAARSAVDDFWRPVVASPNRVLICIGQRRFLGAFPESPNEVSPDIDRIRKGVQDPNAPISLFRLYYMGSENIALPDVVAFGEIAGMLQSKGKQYQVRGESFTSFSDLRDGPVILVGAFNNDWTMRLMGRLRFNYERDGDTFWIQDQQNPARKNRAVNYSRPYLNLTEDYALISRTVDPATERMVVVIGGLTGYGTLAAAEFLSNQSYMQAALQKAPKDWRRKNVQFVIATQVINGNSGPPHLVDQHVW
jgi:hypothetical protein